LAKKRNEFKEPKEAENRIGNSAPPSPHQDAAQTISKTRQRFQELQLVALARSLQPVEHPPYDLKTPVGVIEFSHWLVDARLDRKIGVDDLRGLSAVCDTLLRYYKETGVTEHFGFMAGPQRTIVEIQRVPLRQRVKEEGERIMSDAKRRAAEGLS
jgi:hypothetical protein